MSDFIHLSIITNCGLEFRLATPTEAEAEAAGQAGSSADPSVSSVVVTGPPRACDFVEQQGEGSSVICLSPKTLVTVPRKFRKGAGIPLKAQHFCFVYPTRSVELQQALSQLDLQREAWAFVMLIGGFAYFDAADQLLGVNAVTYSGAASGSALMLIGPSSCTQRGFESLYRQGRLRPMPNSLEGFDLFSWVHPNELLDGELLTKSGEIGGTGDYPHGAMVYSGIPADGSAPTVDDAFVYTMLVPGDPRYIKPGAKAKKRDSAAENQSPSRGVFGRARTVSVSSNAVSLPGGKSLSKAVEALESRASEAFVKKRAVNDGFVSRISVEEQMKLRKTIWKVVTKAVRAAAFIGIGLLCSHARAHA